MKVLGLVVEYNPFHNGHLYHLEQSKKMSGADYVVCVMSGNFIQRGEPAIVNKWARTQMALLAGIDLVIELPSVFAMSSAEYFAYGAVKILDSLGIVDSICFGSESGNIDELNMIADILYKETDNYKSILKGYLGRGLSYPSARENALKEYLGFIYQGGSDTAESALQSNLDSIIGASNNILGIEYLKALKKLDSNIVPFTIERIGNTYNNDNITGSISSATSIRKFISDNIKYGGSSLPGKTLPQASLNILEAEFASGRGPVFTENLENIVFAMLRKMSGKDIKELPYISEGLENRIKKATEEAGCWNELLEKTVTKRYTRTRLQRSLLHSLTGLTSDELKSFMLHGGPQYIRVLGFNSKGRSILSKINSQASLPVVVKTADLKNSCNSLIRRMLEIESSATDMFTLGYSNPEYKKGGQEFTQNIIHMEGGWTD